MVKPGAPVLILSFLLIQGSAKKLSNVSVDFGEYSGWYEGLDDMGLELPRLAVLKSAASADDEPTSQAKTQSDLATMRRYSHLKLMISYMLGTGALAARYTSYGCHCLLGPDVARTATRVGSVDDVDEVCRRQTMCMQCAKIDHGGDCQGGVRGYSFHGERDPNTGERFIVCDNTPGTCRHSLCLCDQALADGFLKFTSEWDESHNHEMGAFNARRHCSSSASSPKPVSSRFSTPNAPLDLPIAQPEEANSSDQRLGGAPFDAAVDVDSDGIILENKSSEILASHGFSGSSTGSNSGSSSGPSVAYSSNVYHAEMVSPNFESSLAFLTVKKEEVGKGMQCCGEYPERFPYQPKTGKACCGFSTYNTNLLECCNGNTLTTIGGC